MTSDLRLYLMRHSEAASAINGDDLNRTLTQQGQQYAQQAASFLANHHIDKMMVSHSQRTLDTASYIRNILNNPVIDILPSLYQSNTEVLIQIIAAQSQIYRRILIIGHNPTLYQTALNLGSTSTACYGHLIAVGMVPAQIVIIEFKRLDSWENIANTKGKIIHIFRPVPDENNTN